MKTQNNISGWVLDKHLLEFDLDMFERNIPYDI